MLLSPFILSVHLIYNILLKRKDLTSLPIEFVLHKGAFIVVMAIFYSFIYNYPYNPFPTIQHNMTLLHHDVCHDVKIDLQPLTGENFRYKTTVCNDAMS